MASSLSSFNTCTPFSTSQTYPSNFIIKTRPNSISVRPCSVRVREPRNVQRMPLQVRCARTVPRVPSIGICNTIPEPRTIQQMVDTMNRLMGIPAAPYTNLGAVPIKETGRYGSGQTPWAIREKENEYKIRFNVPGMTGNDVKIWVEEGNMLVIHAEKEPSEGEDESEDWPAKSFGRYNTRIALPVNVDFKQIKAEVKDGVLYITIPKASSTNRIDIDVK